MEGLAPICPYCKKFSQKVTGERIYPQRADLFSKTFYLCAPCNAYVGCHDGTAQPLGRLADAKLRKAKLMAHDAFDPWWKSKKMKRGEAYRWLAQQLGIDGSDCHIGMFDLETCQKVIDICKNNPGDQV